MSSSTDRLVIARPDDWHVHLRDGPMLRAVAPATARVFARAIVMPNHAQPITTVAAARAYRDRIIKSLTDQGRIVPLITLYIKDNNNAAKVDETRTSGIVHTNKYYPTGAAT